MPVRRRQRHEDAEAVGCPCQRTLIPIDWEPATFIARKAAPPARALPVPNNPWRDWPRCCATILRMDAQAVPPVVRRGGREAACRPAVVKYGLAKLHFVRHALARTYYGMRMARGVNCNPSWRLPPRTLHSGCTRNPLMPTIRESGSEGIYRVPSMPYQSLKSEFMDPVLDEGQALIPQFLAERSVSSYSHTTFNTRLPHHAKLTVPTFLMHGRSDERTSIAR